MKTAISLPDTIFEQADQLASQLHISRSQLYVIALEKFIKDNAVSDITKRIDAFIADHGQPVDPVFINSSLHEMKKVEW